ncbi:MAG TPA: response regulator [Gemmatales bacterium]|nr:response regulator [Gemmatales bacterium]
MAKKVLSVGNCAYDFGTLQSALQQHFSVDVQGVDTAAEAEQLVKQHKYDLIVVNRVFDINQDSGIALIKRLKEHQVATPMVLLSNYPEYQQEAIAAGASPGFGKNQVGKPAMVEAVKAFLA